MVHEKETRENFRPLEHLAARNFRNFFVQLILKGGARQIMVRQDKTHIQQA